MNPLRRVKPGDPLRIPAETWNRLLDLLESSQFAGRRGGAPAQLGPTVPVRNDSGTDVPVGGVLAVSSSAVDCTESGWPHGWCLVGTAPGDDGWQRIAVAADAIPAGAIGQAWIDGVCPVRMEGGTGPWPAYARVVPGETGHLSSSYDSAGAVADVLAVDSANGVAWAIVRLRGVQRSAVVEISATTSTPGVYTGSFQVLDGGALVSSGDCKVWNLPELGRLPNSTPELHAGEQYIGHWAGTTPDGDDLVLISELAPSGGLSRVNITSDETWIGVEEQEAPPGQQQFHIYHMAPPQAVPASLFSRVNVTTDGISSTTYQVEYDDMGHVTSVEQSGDPQWLGFESRWVVTNMYRQGNTLFVIWETIRVLPGGGATYQQEINLG